MHDDDLGNTVTSVHSGIDVTLKSRDTEDCHRIGLTEKTTQKKTIIPLFNHRYYKNASLNRKKLNR